MPSLDRAIGIGDQNYTIGEEARLFVFDPTILVESHTAADVKFECSAALVGGSRGGAKLPPDLIIFDD